MTLCCVSGLIKSMKNKGFSPILIVVAVVVVLLGVGGFAFMNKGGKVALPGGIGLNPNCKYNDPDLCKFMNNWKAQKDYSITYTSSDKNGQKTSEGKFEIQGEGKFHMVTSVAGKEQFNTITIGDTTYTKDYTDNKWWKQKQDKTQEGLTDKFKFDFDKKTVDGKEVEDKTTYTKIGQEACGELTCFKYQVVDPSFTETTEFIFFDTSQYLMRMSRTVDKNGEVNESVFAYGAVNISEPSPVKEAKEGQNIFVPGGADIPAIDQAEIEKLQKQYQDAAKNAPQIDIPTNEGDTTGE